MFGVYYNQFTEGSNKVSWLIPDNGPSNANQYVVVFSQGNDKARQDDVLCIVGDWEYQAVLECLEKASFIMINKDIGYSRTIRSEMFPDTVTMSLLRKADSDRVRIRIDFHEQEPYEAGAAWKGKSPCTFAFYRELDELPELGRIIQKRCEEAPEAAFQVNREDWFVHNDYLRPKGRIDALLPLHENLETIESDLRKKYPQGIHEMWIHFLRQMLPTTEVAKCKSCKKPFYKRARFMKECLSCYRK